MTSSTFRQGTWSPAGDKAHASNALCTTYPDSCWSAGAVGAPGRHHSRVRVAELANHGLDGAVCLLAVLRLVSRQQRLQELLYADVMDRLPMLTGSAAASLRCDVWTQIPSVQVAELRCLINTHPSKGSRNVSDMPNSFAVCRTVPVRQQMAEGCTCGQSWPPKWSST